MAKKQYFLIVDTETTQDNLVADFGAVICDRHGRIFNQCSVLTAGIYTNPELHPLFFDPSATDSSLWSKRGADNRYKKYAAMIKEGSRMVASVAAINKWLAQVMGKYNPILTAYNLPFDTGKCRNTEIDLTMFSQSFCLWSAAYSRWAHTKQYKNFVLSVHGFNNVTKFGNATYQTNAEIMTRFLTGNPDLEDEPHTALEDIIYYELIIFKAFMRGKTVAQLKDIEPYNWRAVQLKDHFIAK